jgi:AcrR family transcriptional regulator
MGRWQPGARGRLQQAAMELYRERGFDQTTVAEIAARAGLTERTFFRYFVDKREVLFAGSTVLQDALVAALDDAPDSAAPIDQVVAALDAAGDFFDNRDFSRHRQAVIDAHPDLQERELIKLASLAAALAEALRRRGVHEPAASLTAEAGIAVFKIAFGRWINDTEERNFTDLIHESLAALKAVAAGGDDDH